MNYEIEPMYMSNVSGGIDGSSNSGAHKSDVVAKTFPKTTLTESEILTKLTKSRCDLVVKNGFLGPIACRLTAVDATKWCKTAATDGKYFYYNRDFIGALPPSQLIFLQGHETCHVIYDHCGQTRRKGRKHRPWNWAADYVINLDLVKCQVGKLITIVDPLYDAQYEGMATEEVYDLIKDKVDDLARKGKGTLDDHFGDGQPIPGDAGQPNEEEGELRAPDENGPAVYTDDEIVRIAQGAKDAAIEAYQNCKDAGSIPGGIKRLLKDMLEPKIDWRTLLVQQIQTVIKANYLWSRPNKKGYPAVWLPSMDREQAIDICVCIDTSGSVDDYMLRDFLSEIYGIMTQYVEFKIQLWCFDTKVGGVAEFTSNNIYDLLTYQKVGGGGTNFEVNWKFMKEHDIVPKKFIMFTDGYPLGGWGDPDYCDTIFVVHGGDGKWASNTVVPEAPFGITVPYYATERKA